jgi:hypothetical protein
MEDITKNTEGKRFEDVEITGIPLMKAQSDCAESSQSGLRWTTRRRRQSPRPTQRHYLSPSFGVGKPPTEAKRSLSRFYHAAALA